MLLLSVSIVEYALFSGVLWIRMGCESVTCRVSFEF